MTIKNGHRHQANRPGRRTRAAALSLFLAALLALPGCDGLLDVENPNNLTEANMRQEAAASAVVNGALSLVSSAISRMWHPYLQASDELTWIGSRDAWLSLDHGFIADPFNEFTDENFPTLGSARWMADEAIEIVEGHVANNPSDGLKYDLMRAYFVSALIYTLIGEVQEDYAFSDRSEPAPPLGPENMYQVLDDAIAKLDEAQRIAAELGETGFETRILAVRARAKHSRALWSKIKPTPNTADPLIGGSGAEVDAAAVVSRVGPTADWNYQLSFSGSTVDNYMAAWINSRAENQFDYSLVEVDPDAIKKVTAIKLLDPIDGVPDPVITAKIREFKGGKITDTGNDYAPLTVASARMMHLILAEHELADGTLAGFVTHINHVRAMDELTDYDGVSPAPLEMLQYERRVNLFLMGLRLTDMYRFGLTDPSWHPNSDVVQSPGTLLPITIIERRANPYLSGSG